MPGSKILKQEWNEYDDRKLKDNRDRSKFACEEPWEVNYLVNKIKKTYHDYTEPEIRVAITECCLIIRAPHPRKDFVDCVMRRLEE
jgi:hypothetical protein